MGRRGLGGGWLLKIDGGDEKEREYTDGRRKNCIAMTSARGRSSCKTSRLAASAWGGL